MRKLSLQWRITILSAIVLMTCTVTLTIIMINNAERTFMSLILPAEATMPVSSESTEQEPIEAIRTQPAQAAKRSFDLSSILFCSLFTLIGTGAVYLVTGRALRPLLQLTEKVDSIDEFSLSKQLIEVVYEDEVSHLTRGFNRMLTRLEDAFLRQKRFTANAAHELKTPLATIKVGAQVLAADELTTLSDYKENLQTTLTSVDRLSKIVDDLLFLASAGEFINTDKEDICLGTLLEAIYSELELSLSVRKMQLKVECEDCHISGNTSLLYRVFFNLIENAYKYGNEGGTIYIRASKQKERIVILVKDDGNGIEAEHLPYIFDAFYRVDKSRSRECGGSGLGLSLVKTMVEACGGVIFVESDGKNGTCFTLSFPQ